MKHNRLWVFCFAALLILSAASALLLRFNGKSGSVANIYIDTTLVYCLDLSAETTPREIVLENAPCNNVIQVEQGRIRVVSATCPDQVCVKQGWSDSALTPIVCLPSRLIIKIEASMPEASQVDGVAK